MSEKEADFITILSSDMIGDIVQVYFDKELYTKKKVKIVDLKPQADGYAFSLSFVVPSIGVTVTNVALPSGTTITCAYRKDEETSYTTIFTNTTANSISKSAINITSSGANLPEFKEIQFRVSVTGGNGEITGIKFKFEVIEKDLY